MVAAYERAIFDPSYAAELLLAYRGIDSPSSKQRIGAFIEADFMTRVIGFLPRPKKR